MPPSISKNSKPVKAEPVVESKPVQKGGKKLDVIAPVVEEPAVKVVKKTVSKDVAEVKPVQKAGASKVDAPKVDAPKAVVAKAVAPKAVAAKAVAEVKPVQKGGAKKVVAKDGSAKKAVVPKQLKAKKVVGDADADADAEDESKGVRSFKVQLPGTEDFLGRFTGLTPYQAANKALSKYFRENKTIKTEIMFSIRESTRGSKRSTYTYNGKREKLDIPVKYSIKSVDGVAREIVKEYKNKLTKVKKGDVKEIVA